MSHSSSRAGHGRYAQTGRGPVDKGPYEGPAQKEIAARYSPADQTRKKEEDHRRGGRGTVRSYRRAARASAPYILLSLLQKAAWVPAH